MSGTHRNRGAAWTQPDGTVVHRGAVFTPTEADLVHRDYKIEALEPEEPPTEQEPELPVQDYAVGGGWYLIHGQKVQGREAAEEVLRGEN